MAKTIFSVGDRVELLSNCKYTQLIKGKYAQLKAGMTGTVRSVYCASSIAVNIDGMINAASQYGAFYFSSNDLRLIEEGEKRKDQTIMEGNYKIADACYIKRDAAYPEENSNCYTFALYDQTVIAGDLCVAKSKSHCFDVVKVLRIREKTDEAIVREIVCKADFSAYIGRLDARKRRDELRKEMAKKAAQLQEIAVYQMLAESDSDMAKLLNEYKELTDGT